MQHNGLIQHASTTGKVVAGGVTTAASSYEVVSHMDIAQATSFASLAAAICTALYFAISAAYAVWKWKKEANGKA